MSTVLDRMNSMDYVRFPTIEPSSQNEVKTYMKRSLRLQYAQPASALLPLSYTFVLKHVLPFWLCSSCVIAIFFARTLQYVYIAR